MDHHYNNGYILYIPLDIWMIDLIDPIQPSIYLMVLQYIPLIVHPMTLW